MITLGTNNSWVKLLLHSVQVVRLHVLTDTQMPPTSCRLRGMVTGTPRCK
jgi:hypothetical protein